MNLELPFIGSLSDLDWIYVELLLGQRSGKFQSAIV